MQRTTLFFVISIVVVVVIGLPSYYFLGQDLGWFGESDTTEGEEKESPIYFVENYFEISESNITQNFIDEKLEGNQLEVIRLRSEVSKLKDENEKLKVKTISDSLQLANLYFQQKDYGRSNFYYDEILEIDPTNFFAIEGKALNYVLLEDPPNSIIYYDKILELRPDYVFALNNNGWSYYLLGEYDTAIEYFDQVLKIDPNDSKALPNKCITLNGKKDYESALNVCEDAWQLTQEHRVQPYLAFTLGVLGKFLEAEPHIDQILERNPDDVFALSKKGAILIMKGNLDEALVFVEKALEIDPNYGEALQNKEAILQMKNS